MSCWLYICCETESESCLGYIFLFTYCHQSNKRLNWRKLLFNSSTKSFKMSEGNAIEIFNCLSNYCSTRNNATFTWWSELETGEKKNTELWNLRLPCAQFNWEIWRKKNELRLRFISISEFRIGKSGLSPELPLSDMKITDVMTWFDLVFLPSSQLSWTHHYIRAIQPVRKSDISECLSSH